MPSTESTDPDYLTTRQATDMLGYSRPDSFLRAWRARGLPLYQRPGGHYLVSRGELDGFLHCVKHTPVRQPDGR